MAIIGMEFFQFALKCVTLGGGESPSPIGWERVTGRSGEGQSSHDVEGIQRPVAFFGSDSAAARLLRNQAKETVAVGRRKNDFILQAGEIERGHVRHGHPIHRAQI